MAPRSSWFKPKPIGSVRMKNGYRYVKVAEGRWEYEHRFVMECLLGRKLATWEEVHHKDEVKVNNVLGNLELKDSVEHGRYHYYAVGVTT